MNSIYATPKPGNFPAVPAPQSTRFLGQMRERLRYLHYSLRTEQTHVYWVRWFIRFHDLRHPREMSQSEVGYRHFLTKRLPASDTVVRLNAYASKASV